MSLRQLAVVAVLLAVASTASARAGTRAQALDRFAAVAERYEKQLVAEGVVGGAVVLFDKNGTLAVRPYGMADRASGRAVDQDTIFHWASVTKVFTAIAAMQLVERGRLDLEAPVTQYLPELRAVRNPFGPIDAVKVKHLLTHSAGFRGASWPWNADGASERAVWQPHEPRHWSQIEAMLPLTTLNFAPGSQASYSNLGMSLLGRIVEILAGESIEIYIDKNVLKPLGMTRSYFDAPPWMSRAHCSHGYTVRDGAIADHGEHVETGATVANGGLNAPVADMVRFARFLLGAPDLYPIVQRATLERMLTAQLDFAREERREVRIGYGFFIVDETDASGATHRYFGHSGFQLGHRASLYLSADGCCGFLFAANTARAGEGNPSATQLRAAMVDEVFPVLFRINRRGGH